MFFVFRNCDKPRLIEALKTKRIRDIACGSSHSAAITSSGELYTWGLGEYGRLGHGDNATQLKPKMVKLCYLSLIMCVYLYGVEYIITRGKKLKIAKFSHVKALFHNGLNSVFRLDMKKKLQIF